MNALWSFALSFYERPGVAAACLALQDEHGADVLLVLYLLHLATAGRTVAADGLRALDAAARDWRQTVIEPLRRIRRSGDWSGHPDWPALRSTIKSAELEAERQQVAFLFEVEIDTQPADSPNDAAHDSLSAYCAHLAVPGYSVTRILELFAQDSGERRPA